MSSMLSSFFSRDPRSTFPYELPAESFTTVQQNIFVGNSSKKGESHEKATCFWSSSPNSSLKTQAQKLKTLRHPNVLTYLDSLEVDGTFYLITEPCRPLDYYLSEVKLTDTQRELLVSWGLYQLLNCLKFLHSEAKISQNNLKDAIFITSSGDWKLAGFHLTSSFSSAQTDLNDLALSIWRIFRNDSSQDEPSGGTALQQIPKRLHILYKRLNARGRAIMAVGDILNESRAVGGFMKNKFVDTLLFLDEFQIRDAAEKQSFFMQLNSNLDLFPEDISRNKILPKLIHTYEYGEAGAHILVPMFKLGRLLEEEEYQLKIVPCLVKLFSSTDRAIRVKLLERIDEFGGHLKAQIINDKIYSNLVTGFMDSNPAVRESTVKAIVAFADKLNYNNLNTDLMKYLARLQGSDPEPSIRTNTTICLGKIGCYIDASHRQRILISAFTRALKDPFPAARMAGVIALSATQQYYSLNEVAQKVLPALAPLAVDPEKQVRDQSFKAMNGFLEKLQKASDNPELIAEMEAQVKAGGKGGLLSGDKVPQWASWAIKSISGKFYKSSAAAAKAQLIPSTGQTTEGKTSTEEQMPKPAEVEREKAQPIPRASSFSSTHSSASARGTNSSVTDGWGEMLDDEAEEEKSEGSEFEQKGGLKKSQDREDRLWTAAMDEWEAIETSSAGQKTGKSSQLKVESREEGKAKETYSSPFVAKKTTSTTKTTAAAGLKGTTTLKLGAVKKTQQRSDRDLDVLLGLDKEDATREGGFDTRAKSASPMGMATDGPGREGGNFASAAKQITMRGKGAEQQKQPQKTREEEPTSNDWQSW